MAESKFVAAGSEFIAQGGGGTVVISPPPMSFTLIPSAETTQFVSGLSVPSIANQESSAAKTGAWYCGNCTAYKQVWVSWSSLPSSGAKYFMKVQWCPWDSNVDADWVDDDSVETVEMSDSSPSSRTLIPISRYGSYLRLKVWQSTGQNKTLDAFGMGKWS